MVSVPLVLLLTSCQLADALNLQKKPHKHSGGSAKRSEGQEAQSSSLLNFTDALGCNYDLEKDGLWGLWIDGRDGNKGPDAYGTGYGDQMKMRLRETYHLITHAGTELRWSDWKAVSQHTNKRNYHNPVGKEVKTCHKAVFPSAHITEIFNGITVMNSKYSDGVTVPKDDPSANNAKAYQRILESLFKKYNARMNAADSEHAKLHAIAFLMRNLAYLHPLEDKNGRTRLLLTQFELRRNRIGCGTMMYNNNKDVYFQTEDEFVSKLKEGLEMYDKAMASGVNPWSAEGMAEEHNKRFEDPYREKLTECWHHFCNYDKEDHTVKRGGAFACVGTRIALEREAFALDPEDLDKIEKDAGNAEETDREE